MIPTNKLRWVRRDLTDVVLSDEDEVESHVLQQWWETQTAFNPSTQRMEAFGEWRDVPVEEE